MFTKKISIIYCGKENGGSWKTKNGSATWPIYATLECALKGNEVGAQEIPVHPFLL